MSEGSRVARGEDRPIWAVGALVLAYGLILLAVPNTIARLWLHRQAIFVPGAQVRFDPDGVPVVVGAHPREGVVLRAGDRVLDWRLDGEAHPRRPPSHFGLLPYGPPAAPRAVRFRVERGGRVLQLSGEVAFRPWSLEDWSEASAHLLLSLCCFALGALLLFRGRDRAALWLSAGLLGWAGDLSSLPCPGLPPGWWHAEQVLLSVTTLLGWIGLPSLAYFFLVYPEPADWLGTRRGRWIAMAGFLPALAFGAARGALPWPWMPPELQIRLTEHAQHLFKVGHSLGPTYTLLAVAFAIWAYRRTAREDGRRRLRWIAAGALVSLIPNTLGQLAALAHQLAGRPGPPGGIPAWLELTLAPFALALPAAFAHAIFRERLFDLGDALRLGARYALARGGLVLAGVLPPVILAGFALWSRRDEPLGSGLAGAAPELLLILLAAALLWRIHGRARAWLDARFFRTAYDTERILSTLAGELGAAGRSRSLGAHVLDRIGEALHPERAWFFARDEAGRLAPEASWVPGGGAAPTPPFLAAAGGLVRWLAAAKAPGYPPGDAGAEGAALAEHGVEWLVPVRGAAGELLGALALGPRRSQSPYSPADARLLAGVASELGLALDNSRLYREATVDPLTGLLRREPFLARLAQETERALHFNQPVALVMIDLDHFKAVNDTRGHEAGDRVLAAAGAALAAHLRRIDAAARLGGEELALLLPGMDESEAAAVAERVRADFAALEIPDPGRAPIRFTASFGVADSTGGEGLLGRADLALYEAKRGGRNTVRLARPYSPA